jgi:hypothetical protein
MWLIFLKNMKVSDELMKIAVVTSAADLVRGSAWTERTRGDSCTRKLSSNETASARNCAASLYLMPLSEEAGTQKAAGP